MKNLGGNQPGTDVAILELPAGSRALLPNGLAHVHNALKRARTAARGPMASPHRSGTIHAHARAGSVFDEARQPFR
ncbi:hypothetical protein [Azospirillum argentinense]